MGGWGTATSTALELRKPTLEESALLETLHRHIPPHLHLHPSYSGSCPFFFKAAFPRYLPSSPSPLPTPPPLPGPALRKYPSLKDTRTDVMTVGGVGWGAARPSEGRQTRGPLLFAFMRKKVHISGRDRTEPVHVLAADGPEWPVLLNPVTLN